MLNKSDLLPPMGWNSWNCYGIHMDSEKIYKQAKALVDTGLAEIGFRYINIDDGWQGERGGKYGAIMPNDNFKNIKELIESINALGLKFGIYSTPWEIGYSGFIGSKGYEENDVMQFAEWGVDFLKYDWAMSDPDEPSEEFVEKIYNAINKVEREIMLSLSNNAPLEKAEVWSKYSNLWRTTRDITDNWDNVSSIGFDLHIQWRNYVSPGRFPDPDMMVVGMVGCTHPPVPGKLWATKLHPSRLTRNEQISHFLLWTMYSAPIMLGCDLTKLNDDDFMVSLLTNVDIVSINQDPLVIPAYRQSVEDNKEIWIKPLSNNKKAVAFFNRNNEDTDIHFQWRKIYIKKGLKIYEPLEKKILGVTNNDFKVELQPHGSRLFILE